MSLLDVFPLEKNVENKRIFGVLTGIVTNNKDPENLGRVKLKLPLRECQNETDWVRVAVPMAGGSRGIYFLPEVDDEVLVAFHDADVGKPYVIGALWNSKDKPPVNNADGKNNIRLLQSRSGHQLTFNDESGKEKIEIKTKAGQLINLDDTGSGKIDLKSGPNHITIDQAANSITINTASKIIIKTAGGSLEIDESSVKLQSNLQMNIKAQMLNIEAGASLSIKSDGIVEIKGAMVKIN